MGDDVEKDVEVTLDPKVKPPPSIDMGLPALAVILFGPERGVTKVPKEVGELLAKKSLNLRRCLDEALSKWFSDECTHVRVA
jgi:hypothetical protein